MPDRSLGQNEDDTLLRVIAEAADPAVIEHIPVFATRINGSRQHVLMDTRPAHSVLIKEKREHGSHGDRAGCRP